MIKIIRSLNKDVDQINVFSTGTYAEFNRYLNYPCPAEREKTAANYKPVL